MISFDIEDIPQIGEKVAVPEMNTYEPEFLECIHYKQDPITSEMMGKPVVHVFFQSPEASDNIYMEDGIPYYTIRTYC